MTAGMVEVVDLVKVDLKILVETLGVMVKRVE